MARVLAICLLLFVWSSWAVDIPVEHIDDLLLMTNHRVRNFLEVSDTVQSVKSTRFYEKHVSPEVLEIGIRSVVFDTASAEISKRYNLTKREADILLEERADSRPGLDANSICTRTVTGCSGTAKYRTADGSCNNLARPQEGMAVSRFDRFIPAQYGDGVRTFRLSVTGEALVSPRIIRLIVHPDRNISHDFASNMITGFGQFLDHDITSTPEFRNLKCCQGSNNPECMQVPVPTNDSFYPLFGIQCLEISRSIPACGSGVREQINQVTAFIDGSMIYGSSLAEQQGLRLMSNGLLLTDTANNRLLPKNPQDANCGNPQNGIVCFKAGDGRVNENPALTSIHTTFLREHNRIATGLRAINPGWNDETLFQETRRIVVAEIQNVVYSEFLRVVLGPEVMNNNFLNLPSGTAGTTVYNSSVRAIIFNSFATAAYRFGHTLLQNQYNMPGSSNGSFLLGTSIQNPHVLYQDFANIDRIMQGLAQQRSQDYDIWVAEAVTNHLFQGPNAQFGFDLTSRNIQRGGDHGLPPYNRFRMACGLSRLNNFSDLLGVTQDQEFVDRYTDAYRSVDDIDLWSGGIGERPVNGGIVGPTFAFIIGKQFNRLLMGDRFFFTHGNQSGSFTQAQLSNLRRRTLASIICDNASPTITSLQQNVFLTGGTSIACSSHPKLNLNNWKA